MGICVSYLMHLFNGNSEVVHCGIALMEKHLMTWNVPTTEGSDNESPIYRSILGAAEDPQKNWDRYYDCTLFKAVRESCIRNAKKPAAGIRPVDHIEKSTITDAKGKKKKWECVHFKPTISYTYAELWKRVEYIGEGFMKLGIKKGMTVGIYEDTRLEWWLTCYGLWMCGAVGVTVYANLGPDALGYAIYEADVQYIVLNGNLIENIIKICDTRGAKVPFLIYIDDLPERMSEKIEKHNIKAKKWQDIYQEGEDAVIKDGISKYDEVQPNDLALIMYTSGTTGNPKGVVTTHGNIHAAVQLVSERVGMIPEKGNEPGAEGVENKAYVAFLPLAHILELVTENIMYTRGWYVGYGSPRTLVDLAAKPHGDLKEFNPFLFVGVPRIFDTIKKAIEGQIPSGIKRKVFDRAYSDRLDALKRGKETPFYNEKVFAAPRKAFGNSCRCLLSGGAPMSAKAQEFLMVVCGTPIVQGYGLTEVCAGVCTQLPWDMHTEEIGAIFNGIEVKLRATDEFVVSEDAPAFVGEILIKGPCVTKGYYMQYERTKECFLEDGFFVTGDVGTFVKGTNNLKIVGRVKALAKTAQGEYIAMETLESIYVLDPLTLPNGVCVLVNSQKPFIAALINTDESKAMEFAEKHGIKGTWPDILLQRNFNEAATESLTAIAKANGRERLEIIKTVKVVADDWSPESGIMTSAHKIRRSEIDIKYKNIIDELFSSEDTGSTLI